jgi:DNA-binding IclR family transcriptional regulator
MASGFHMCRLNSICGNRFNVLSRRIELDDAAVLHASKPGAPALEKGLDVLELLAANVDGLTQKQIADGVGRSVSEIFRMLTVLKQRGYVAQDRRGGEYTLTLRLFRLATQHPPTRRLQQAALGAMQHLVAATDLSCHLSVLHGSQFMVSAQTEPDWQMGWTVKLGATFPLSLDYASARVLAAFQASARRSELAALIAAHDRIEARKVLDLLLAIEAAGGDFGGKEMAAGVTSLSCPVVGVSGHAVAALTVPVLREIGKPVNETAVAVTLRDAAQTISTRIGGGEAD